MTPRELARAGREAALRLGFEACGITDLAPSAAADQLDAWLSSGYHGQMRYMARQAATRRAPRLAWRHAKSVVVVLHNYYSAGGRGSLPYRVAQYAQGEDYHRVTKRKLDRLGAALVAVAGSGECRSYVDAGPLPERELARRAGLGWVAKNTMLIHPKLGSYTFIGCLLTDLELEPDAPFEADRCGTCTRCLDACPTQAFPEPRVLDATRCISYLTIEARGDVPAPLRSALGDHLFGCDVCQDVCPWNRRFAAETREPAFQPRPASEWPTAEQILEMDDAAFDRRFGPTALERAGRAGLARNAGVVLENRESASGRAATPGGSAPEDSPSGTARRSSQRRG